MCIRDSLQTQGRPDLLIGQALHLPQHLRDFGIEESMLPKMANHWMHMRRRERCAGQLADGVGFCREL